MIDELGTLRRLVTASDRSLIIPPTYWSEPIEEISLTQAAATLPVALAAWDVTVTNLPAGAVVTIAKAVWMFRIAENANALANGLDGATVAATSQVIQVETDAPGTWRDAINFPDDWCTLGATINLRENGIPVIGTPNIAVEVTGNDTYHFRWLLSKAQQDNLIYNDNQFGLVIAYSI